MNKTIKVILRTALFILVGVAIFWFVYKDLNTDKIIAALKDADYRWIAVTLILGVISHISRAMRWVLLIRPLGYKPTVRNSFLAVMIMYLSNIAVPRSGELIRCSVMKRYEKIPFTKLLGTVITERVFDFILLFIMLGIVLIYQIADIQTIIDNNPGVYDKLTSFFNAKVLIILTLAGITGLGLLYLLRSKLKETIVWKKLSEFLINIIEGVKTVWKMERKVEFIFHSVLIWVLYFIMIYVAFFAFDFTFNLTVMQGLTIFVMASFGMVFPSPGGIGSWHFMVIQTLFIYGISNPDEAGAFAFAVHGSMTLMLIVLGAVSFVLMPVLNKEKLVLGNS